MEKPKKVKKPRGKASLIPNKCIACGARCQSSCPAEAIEMNEKGEPLILADKCIGCQKCVKICPAEALEMFFTPEELEILVRDFAVQLLKNRSQSFRSQLAKQCKDRLLLSGC